MGGLQDLVLAGMNAAKHQLLRELPARLLVLVLVGRVDAVVLQILPANGIIIYSPSVLVVAGDQVVVDQVQLDQVVVVAADRVAVTVRVFQQLAVLLLLKAAMPIIH